MEGWPDPPGWEQQYDSESRRWHEEVEKRVTKCEADLRVMRLWPEYQETKDESDSERHPEHV